MVQPRLSVWLVGNPGPVHDAARSAIAADDKLTVTARAWPEPDERTAAAPHAVVCLSELPETPWALRRRLAEADGGSGVTTRVVVIVAEADVAAARVTLTMGADAIVLADDIPAVLASTVRAACGGQLVVPRALGHSIERPVLTTREKQILGLVVLGLTNREISKQLFLSESTVKSHLHSAFRRIGVSTRKDAIALILDRDQGLGSGILRISDS